MGRGLWQSQHHCMYHFCKCIFSILGTMYCDAQLLRREVESAGHVVWSFPYTCTSCLTSSTKTVFGAFNNIFTLYASLLCMHCKLFFYKKTCHRIRMWKCILKYLLLLLLCCEFRMCECVALCASVDDCVACTYTRIHVCNDKTETRDALQLLVPSDEAESSSDRFHLPCLNLNLPGCGMSNSLRTTGICQPTSKCFFFHSFIPFSAVTKGFKRASTQAARHLLCSLVCASLSWQFSMLTLEFEKWINVVV